MQNELQLAVIFLVPLHIFYTIVFKQNTVHWIEGKKL